MKLQIALDTCNQKEALAILHDVADFIDVIEVGTPMIIEYGMEPVRAISKEFPNKLVLADTKIMDAGEYEADIAFKAGAQIVTVMGITHDETIKGAVKAAKNGNGKILADMMCVQNLEERAKELVELGVDYICVHTAFDVQDKQSPFDSLSKVQNMVGSQHSAIAGGINIHSVDKVIPFKPEIMIVGNGITGQDDRRKTAKMIKQLLV
ncbi:3-hexulose-6-phosphate synthase [Neobacillus niacini]|jgi:3-hexulose-6-phosphate synthase|uniref:3-hexulose-6-phosphate synthase n=1 Tax=Neobacillus niacini TaxID=86668 RepID=UPI002789A21D|nr:3-hexulose-6-phosphate synthase [Neobacillus niacini]MDQ1004887.1 3-hexulose-6-phosphate synthase [Neobacillus niacini]